MPMYDLIEDTGVDISIIEGTLFKKDATVNKLKKSNLKKADKMGRISDLRLKSQGRRQVQSSKCSEKGIEIEDRCSCMPKLRRNCCYSPVQLIRIHPSYGTGQ